MKNNIKMRVVKGDWSSGKTLFVSEPMSFRKAFLLEAKMVPDLPARGEDTKLVKIVQDKGNSYQYMNPDCGGWMIYTHHEIVIF